MKKIYSVFFKLLFLCSEVCLLLTYGCRSVALLPSNIVTDIDGNTYDTVKIGTQVWMVENLKTTHFNDGTAIPNISDANEWSNLITPGYCWYDNSLITYGSTYGALYNWYAINTDKLCPTGWHVPTNNEFKELIDSLGIEEAHYKLMEVGSAHWFGVSFRTTNETGFTAIPGGLRREDGAFDLIGNSASWWSSDQFSDEFGIDFGMGLSDYANVFMQKKRAGLSVRCLKD